MEIEIKTEYIKLEQLLKYANLVETGGMAKQAIQEGLVLLNGEVEIRRGKKIYKGDIVKFNNEEIRVK
ncbi:S4 domain-containing protein YaaA [Sneathia sanguinegens]|jgi:hypothetical protein|uniref:S4 domain-containing protein YaaA n=1 Tax=Sneathia sanguinegens TaxID=40543 RepID=UPI0023F7CA97|nr:S4 domain-containing protein YaaA [Sneathia sanguinegens]